MIVIDRAEWRTMRWANGGGTTHEVMIEPPGATTDAFDWRISVAEVHTPGPFSSLPGVDRLLLLIGGAGMSVHIDGVAHEASRVTPLSFRGESEALCESLADGATLDLNVMVRRDRYSASLTVVPANSRVTCAVNERVVVFALTTFTTVLADFAEEITIAEESAVIRLRATSTDD